MPGPNVTVTTSETIGAAGTASSTGTAFIVQESNYGPETPTMVRSLAEYTLLYGPRETGTTKLYDAVDLFFKLEGNKAYINRAAGEGSPAAAKEELETAGKTKVLIVEAKYKGTYGNKLEIQVKSSGATLTIYNPSGEVLEESGEYTKASELLEWGEKHTAYITIKEGSNYSTGKGEALKVLAKKVLAGGANPSGTTANLFTKAIEAFGKALGPGTLLCPGNFEEAVHKAMGEHGSKLGSLVFAWCDLKEAEKAGVTAATLIAEKGSYATTISGYMAFTASTVVIPGVTSGTTRTVSGSVAAAGLRAKVAAKENDNVAPCGRSWPLQQTILSFTNTFSQANVELLSEKGINAFAELPGGVLCLYGFVTALPKESDIIFWQASASYERMKLVTESERIGERSLFKTIDGRRQLLSRFQGELQGMLARQWELNALYGATAPEAFEVKIGEPINTPTTAANGELNAELYVRLSPFAQLVKIGIVSVPVTEPV